MGFPGESVVKNPPANAGAEGDATLIPWVKKSPWSLEVAIHSNIPAEIIPWTEKPVKLHSVGLLRGRPDKATEHTHRVINTCQLLVPLGCHHY